MNTHSHNQYQEDFTFFRPKPDGDIDPAGEAGWFLQRERERLGHSLEKAGEACGVHSRHLTGIELGDFTQLPGRTDALRMVGQYAKFLGFDPQPLVLHYAQFLPQTIQTRRVVRGRKPRPFSSAKILSFPNLDKLKVMTSGAGGIVASVFAAIVVFEGAVYMLSPGGDAIQPVKLEKVVEAETAPLPVNVGAASKNDGQIVSSIATISEEPLADSAEQRLSKEADKAASGLSGLTELIQKDLSSAKIPLPKAKPVRAANVEVAGLAATGDATKAADAGQDSNAKPADAGTSITGNENSRLMLTAKENVWLRIEDRDGNVVVTQTLQKGDSYRVPNREGLVVIARDGGLLSYAIDGKTMGTLGDQGEILVGRPLDIGALANGQG